MVFAVVAGSSRFFAPFVFVNLNVFDLSLPVVQTWMAMVAQIGVLIFYVLALFRGQAGEPASVYSFSGHQIASEASVSREKCDSASTKSTVEHSVFQRSFLAKRDNPGKPPRFLFVGLSRTLKNSLIGRHSVPPSLSLRAGHALSFRLSPLQLIEVLLI